MKLRSIPFSAHAVVLVTLTLLQGCGGGGGSSDDTGRTMGFGPFITRIAGTVEPPVTGGEKGVAVTGVAGGAITSMVLQDAAIDRGESRIAFVSTRDGYDIFVVNPAGGDPVRLITSSGNDTSPAWSPDGTKIAFASSRDGNYEVYTANSDGSSPVRRTTNAAVEASPMWSPDSAKIAFTSTRDGNREVYVMNADGGSQTRLTNHLSDDNSPAWSPDGAKIAFNSGRDGNLEIYVMSSTGLTPTRLTNNSLPDTDPCWSPDGSRITWTSGSSGNDDIWVMYANGTFPVKLTTSTLQDNDPSWSPDGGKIAFASDRDGNAELYTMFADGSGQARLTNGGAVDAAPAWGPVPLRRTLIGAAGSMGTNAAGFIYGRAGNVLKCVLTFDALTRTSARIKNQVAPGSGLPNVVMSISADSINRIAFLNFTDTLPKVAVAVGAGSPLLTCTDAIIDFNADIGNISSVLPYIANRSGAPVVTEEGGLRVFRGRFLAAVDNQGVNHAPNGATEVRVDEKLGKIVSAK